MYLRFIRLVVREGAESEFQTFYRRRVLPALAEVPGCRFAGLLTPWRSDDHRSLTLWRSAEDAKAYEEGGLYHQLLKETTGYLSSRTVWRVRLSDDPLETLVPGESAAGQRELPPEGYELGDEGAGEELGKLARSVYVRVVAVHLIPKYRDEFLSSYHSLVEPALKATPGCLGALLAEGTRDRNEALSITVWDREESATRYEMSGEFERLSRQLESTLLPVSQWQLVLGEGAAGRADGGERRRVPDVATYHLIHSRKLGRGDKAD